MGTSYFNQTVKVGKQETIIKELVQGHHFASQLQLHINKQPTNGDLHCYSPTTNELLHKILASFTDAISALTTANGSDENIQAATSHGEQQSSAGSGQFEDSGESRKIRPPPVEKSGAAGRGSYKRRKSGHSRIIVSSSFTQDGHAWRKYGQKEILHAKFPRSYFRCTYKYEQGCKATKQVQRLEQEKEMYSITYLGHHTCRNALKTVFPSAVPSTTEMETVVADSSQNEQSVTMNVKQEISNGNNEESTPSGVTVDDEVIENDENMNIWQDLVSFELEAEDVVSNYGYDYGNYDYCGHDAFNSPILDLDFVTKNINFDERF